MDAKHLKIGGGISVYVSENHGFGTDSFLLSDFVMPRVTDIVCDLGTGCGIIPMLWFREGESAPKETWGVDIQEEAGILFDKSIAEAGLGERVHSLTADIRSLRGRFPMGKFDVISCNPPYNAVGAGIPSKKESELIARHETECRIKDVCAAAKYLLRYGGKLCLCQLPGRLAEIFAAMQEHQIEPKRLRMVQQTAGSAPWLFLVEGRLGGKPHLKIEPPLIMRENNEYTEEMQRIYRQFSENAVQESKLCDLG